MTSTGAPAATARSPTTAGWTVPLAIPEIGAEERRLVDEACSLGWGSYGACVERFETEVGRLLGVSHAVSTSSGTAALHVALLAAGVGPGDEVVVPALTFVAPANAVRYVGAEPVFVDVEAEYRQLDVEKLATFFADDCVDRRDGLRNRATGRRVAAVVAVDLLGHPADLDAVTEICQTHGVRVIEDAAESLGARLRGRPAGALAELGCVSFNVNKIVTSGGGGIVATDDAAMAARVRHLTTQAKVDSFEYVHDVVGFNYSLSPLHAALGYGQLLRLAEFVEAKRRIAATYRDELGDVRGIAAPREAPWAFSTFWLYTIQVDAGTYGVDNRELMRRLRAAGIEVRPLWQPLHASPAHAGAQAYRCEVADRLYATAVSLPCSVSLRREQQARVIAEIRAAGRRNGPGAPRGR